VPGYRYPQFCSVARGAEIIGERWTLLVLRELMFGPQRFVDIRRRLSDVSPSVLSDRLTGLETAGIVEKTELPPPAASTVYRLTESGSEVVPVIAALGRWGRRYLFPTRRGEQLDADRLLFILDRIASSEPGPELSCTLKVADGDGELIVHVEGGERGTEVSRVDAVPESSRAVITGEAIDIISMFGGSDGDDVTKRVRVEGDEDVIPLIPRLFDLDGDPSPPPSAPQATGKGE